MKKMFIVFLMAIALTGCGKPNSCRVRNTPTGSSKLYTQTEWKEMSTFEDSTTTFEESEAKASPEYWEELEYNSRENEW